MLRATFDEDTYGSTTVVCSDSKDLGSPDNKEMVIDVDEDDIQDCMLGSTDLSKKLRIHNLQVIINNDGDEQDVTTSVLTS